MELDQYAHLSSPVHAWDPRWKLAGLGGFVCVAAVLQQHDAVLAAFASGAIACIVSRLPWRFVATRLRGPLVLVFMMAIPLMFTAGGPSLARWGPLSVSQLGVVLSVRIGLKVIAVVLLFLALFGTAPVAITLKAARSMGVPSTLVTLFLFTYRFIFLYREDLEKLLTAARLRGYQLRRGILSLQGTIGLFATLLVRSYEQSERVAAAMRLRGFTGDYRAVGQFRTSFADVAKLSIALAAILSCAALEIL